MSAKAHILIVKLDLEEIHAAPSVRFIKYKMIFPLYYHLAQLATKILICVIPELAVWEIIMLSGSSFVP